MNAVDIVGTLEPVTCFSCGVVFGIESVRRSELLAKHGTFWCINGHPQHYTGESEAERERKLRGYAENRALVAEQRRARLESTLRATKGHMTRMKRRIGNGVCPCCKRSFAQLASHMKAKHPTFGKTHE